MSLIAEELRSDLVAMDCEREDHVSCQRRESSPAMGGRMHGATEVRAWHTDADGGRSDGGVHAARGAVFGVSLGALSWSAVGAFLYFIVLRWN